MKTFITTLYLLLICLIGFAQETEERAQKSYNNIIERYHVQKANPEVKEGLYQAMLKKTALATGKYKNNVRVGTWYFLNGDGAVTQKYNYDTNILIYEEPNVNLNDFRYVFDKQVKKSDVITKPIRIGGKYWGYLPYVALYQKPKDFKLSTGGIVMPVIELLISPEGNLANYIIHMDTSYGVKNLNVNIDLLKPEDKLFIPATLNGQPVAATIIVRCKIYGGSNEMLLL
jgi:hypothetical protein